MTLCPTLMKDGHYMDFGQVLEKLTWVIGEYNKCAVRHEALVDYNKKVK